MVVHAHITGKDPLPFANKSKAKAKAVKKDAELDALEQADGKYKQINK